MLPNISLAQISQSIKFAHQHVVKLSPSLPHLMEGNKYQTEKSCFLSPCPFLSSSYNSEYIGLANISPWIGYRNLYLFNLKKRNKRKLLFLAIGHSLWLLLGHWHKENLLTSLKCDALEHRHNES